MKNKVRMMGYDGEGRIVYSDSLDTGDYYDGEHVWDRSDSILALGLVRVVGEKFDADGKIFQSWETAFSGETGEYIGSIGKLDDGTVKRDGIYSQDEQPMNLVDLEASASGIREGLADLEAGRTISFEDMVAELEERAQKRQASRESGEKQ